MAAMMAWRSGSSASSSSDSAARADSSSASSALICSRSAWARVTICWATSSEIPSSAAFWAMTSWGVGGRGGGSAWAPMHQGEGLALVGRQVLHGFVDGPPQPSISLASRRGGQLALPHRGPLVSQPTPAASVGTLTDEDAVEPGGELGLLAKSRQGPPGANEGVLGHLLGHALVLTGQPPGHAHSAITVLFDEEREALLTAGGAGEGHVCDAHYPTPGQGWNTWVRELVYDSVKISW